ncbi:4-aminobutyrate aminotransferase apoenzyme [Desulfotomaculum arcticum]|uniref:(S)-3-amino-2-methylpropionate transaminase n=1 Tax=Desulfotruncus arcticus DSM 17038 TaxID=1121424 RepID=A0A1I2YMG4_9FIRM|nr:aspartate aminotransferase family protein [Desulfotruncus arcticus]SFH26864.1 4-aminobutyrate aminotransferase apoenzyme [Desulfotomaculum arcticum] [Desulfotruncus arcticus DSM 17038]
MVDMDLLNKGKKRLSPVLARATQMIIERGEGAYLYSIDGEKYLDFVSGIAVNNLGHCHPKVVAAAKEQIDQLMHGSFSLGYYPSALKLAVKLAEVTPGDLDMFFFSNSGAEAVEGALKLARWKTKKPGYIAFRGGFHGRSMGALSVTSSRAGFRDRYAPFLPTIVHVPYPYCYRCPYGQKTDACSLECLAEIKRVFNSVISPSDVAAMIFEPVQGEGGYIVPPAKYVHGLRALCSDHNIYLIFDEVQTGFGRTGKMFAAEHFGVIPDIVCLGKAIASGMPLSAVASREAIIGDWAPGAHGSTFGANPVSCAAAVAMLEVFEEENVLQNCNTVGEYFKAQLLALQEQFPVIGDVRGLGLMLAVELVDSSGSPNPAATNKVTNYCLEHKLLFYNCGVYKNCIRFITPLNISKSVVDEGLAIFKAALKSV